MMGEKGHQGVWSVVTCRPWYREFIFDSQCCGRVLSRKALKGYFATLQRTHYRGTRVKSGIAIKSCCAPGEI